MFLLKDQEMLMKRKRAKNIEDLIYNRLKEFKQENNIHNYQQLLDITDLFIQSFPEGVNDDNELDLGIELLRELISISMITSLRQYEQDHNLYHAILIKKVKVFKLCIPKSHKKLRGLTELLLGMKENFVDQFKN